MLGIALLAILVTGVLMFAKSVPAGNSVLSFFKFNFGYSADAVAKKSVEYLNNNILQEGQTATLIGASEESGVIKMKIQIGANTYDSYTTKDGRLLFPEAITLGDLSPTQTPVQNIQAANTITPANVKKAEKTSLDVYVVSKCPFGLQVQRAIANAVTAIPSLAEFIKVRYIGAVSGTTITAMHGEAEAQENLRQICIRDEQGSKYWPYISCHIKNGDTAGCQASAGVNASQLTACIKDANRGVTYAKADFDLNAKYHIQGSPTFVLNGEQILEDAFGGRSADGMKNIICSSSISEPGFCKTKLNTSPASTSFSLTYAGSGAIASGNVNCLPTTVQ